MNRMLAALAAISTAVLAAIFYAVVSGDPTATDPADGPGDDLLDWCVTHPDRTTCPDYPEETP